MTFCEKLFGTIKKRRNKTTQKRVVRGKPRSLQYKVYTYELTEKDHVSHLKGGVPCMTAHAWSA